ncbi:MAG TPA: VTT domain-containing protein [Solirubrobacteraceae bacterium]|nr:VTT domain-containing protein [Solirubrobacteraceae bacterium]
MSAGEPDTQPAAPVDTAAPPHPRTMLVAGLITIVLAVAVITAVPQLRHCVSLVLNGEFTALRSYIRSLDAGGFALLMGLMLGHAIVFYPSEIVTATAAYVYGFLPGLAVVVVGWLLAAVLSYALGLAVGRPLLRRLLGERFIRLERAVDRGGTSLLLSARLIPVVPFALMGYAAGATRVNLWKFSWTTVIGYLPLTAAVAYLGANAETLSASNPIVWIVVAALIGALVAEWIIRHKRRAASTHGGSAGGGG